MKTILGSRIRRYLTRASILLITAALIAGMVGCGPAEEEEGAIYELTIGSSDGGSVASPGQGSFKYPYGTVVNLMAVAEIGYGFVMWTGDVSTIADVNNATTTITIKTDCSITANFAPLRHLTISPTIGGGLKAPGEGTFTYRHGTAVALAAAHWTGPWRFFRWMGDVGSIDDVNDASTTITMNGNYEITPNFKRIFMVETGGFPARAVGLRSDGTVLTTPLTWVDGPDPSGWTDIIQVAAGADHVVGLKADGTVVASRYDLARDDGQCDVGDWSNIVEVTAGSSFTVGVRADGTAVAVGYTDYGHPNVSSWKDIVQVAAGVKHAVGLAVNGTVLHWGDHEQGQCDVNGWSNIIYVACGDFHTVGLRSDGTVLATGLNDHGQCEVNNWIDIVQVAAGTYHTLGLKSNGTVVAAGQQGSSQCDVSNWTGIIQVAASYYASVGLRSNGTVASTEFCYPGQCYLEEWDLD
jgi:alpha-tubulin suppressor-like RCC1 family protein